MPVKYTNAPTDFLNENLPSDTLQLKISALGYQIVLLKISQPKLVIDIKREKLDKKNFWLPSDYYNVVNELIGSENSIISISPKQIDFKLNEIYKKHVKIIPKCETHYLQGYKNKNKIKIKPDSIWIFGNRKAIDSINMINTKSIVLNNVSSNVLKKVPLDFPKGIKGNLKEVNCVIDVDQFIESESKMDYKLINVPDTINVVLFPKKVLIKYVVFRSDYKKTDDMNIEIVLDYNKRDSVLYPKVLQKPSFIFDVSVYPKKIAFLTKNN